MDQILQLLAAMGDTADAVAATLRAEGIRGHRDSPSFQNPIVRYLNRHLNIGHRLEVGAGGSVLRVISGGRVQEAGLSEPVRDFLQRFHQGLYDDLEAA
jgi:hypothetical protein